jgi:flagellar biosynthesis/type III secretory pathway protein FliH
MGRIIKLEDNPESIETIDYTPLAQEPEPSVHARDEETAIVYKVSEMKRQMEELISAARDEAEGIVQQANAEAAEIKEQASKSGYDAGQEAGLREMKAKMDDISEAFRKGLEDIASIKQDILAQAEGEIVKLTIAIAEKLLCSELEQSPDTIVPIIGEAIRAAQSVSAITVRINPDDHATLKQNMGKLMEYLDEARVGEREIPSIQLIEDRDLTPGGCIVETDTNLTRESSQSR